MICLSSVGFLNNITNRQRNLTINPWKVKQKTKIFQTVTLGGTISRVAISDLEIVKLLN